MNLFAKKAAGLIAGGLVALSLSTSTLAADKTLYERLGGKPALEAVVGELWNNVAADARINHFFKHTKPEVFGGQLVDFLCQGAGGPCQYKGKDMTAAHTGMKLSDGDFNALAENTIKALNKFNVPKKEHDEVMNMLGGMRGAIVGK
jgi:hemoglobin